MSKITIKIIDIDAGANHVIVKYASDTSARPIDEYSAQGFPISDPSIQTPEQFIESIRYDVSRHVAVRDALELHIGSLDLASWNGFTTEVDASDLVAINSVQINNQGLANPEIVL